MKAIQFFTLVCAAASVFSVNSALAGEAKIACSVVKAATGPHTISTDSGELGDNEDGTPAVESGFLLVVNCNSLERNIFFSLPSDSNKVRSLLKSSTQQEPVLIDFVSNDAGVEGRGTVSVPSIANTTHLLTDLQGFELMQRFEVIK